MCTIDSQLSYSSDYKVLIAYGSHSIFLASKEQGSNPCIIIRSLKTKAKIKKLDVNNYATPTN